MKIQHTAILAAVALVPSCSFGQAVRVNESGDIPARRWQAAMSSPQNLDGAVEMAGTAWIAAGEDSNTTRVAVDIENAAPGGVHPWGVHQGRCGSDRGLFGSSDDYEPLEVGGDGRASASSTIERALPASGDYHVSILASPSNRDMVIACGNLAPPIG